MRGGQTINCSSEEDQNLKSLETQKTKKLKKKKIGAILIEVAFTLPIVVYLMFFCIELIKINITQEALQSICEEATYLTIAHDYTSGADLIAKVDAIIEKYRPSFIPQKAPGYTEEEWPVIRWVYSYYKDLGNMLQSIPYGGNSIFYPAYEVTDYAHRDHAGVVYWDQVSQYIPSCNMKYQENPQNIWSASSYMKDAGLPNNAVFTITFVCNYPFSSGIVKMLFGGGVNTRKINSNGVVV